MIEFDLEVNALGLQCPLPLLHLKKALVSLDSGRVIKIMATDPAAHLDFGVYAEQSGHQIIEFLKEADKQVFYVRKK